jgi:transcriptional regulator with XRE-family HTH domain
MPAAAPLIAPTADHRLTAFGRRIHERRKALKISATTAAEAAGISRMTLHRIERGEPSVTMGAYMSTQAAAPVPVPDGIRIADYPHLRRLGWQLAPDTELTPEEAWATYERNWRHVDASALDVRERALLDDLARVLGREPFHA